MEYLPATDWIKNGDEPILISGPCSAESPEQLMQTAKRIVAKHPNNIFRAGIWKPRTQPGQFEGRGEEGLKWLLDVKQETGMLTATEVATPAHIELALKYKVDILWIGTRTTVNPFIVQELANALTGVDIPMLVKNPIHPDPQLWLGAMNRFSKAGIRKLGAIHRGFFTDVKSEYRNLPKWDIVLAVRTLYPDLPMICDISHIAGNTSRLQTLAQHATDINLDGLMIETHIDPSCALSDKDQQVTPDQLDELLLNVQVKHTAFTDSTVLAELNLIRNQINQLDATLMQTLSDRMKLAEIIGRLKMEHNVTILQMDRWKEIIDRSMASAAESGLSSEFIRNIFMLIHDESIRLQSEIEPAKKLS
ncbi:MAG TPA: chorismate mutase [Bacteroidia bacterium]|nr:chorismate mutase [Bacteroidia bacterium]